jgi:CBS domain-containing protein
MTTTTRPLSNLTASDLMRRDVVTISEDASLRAVQELFVQRKVDEAVVVDAEGRYVGVLSASDLLHWALGSARDGAEDAPPPCPYQVKGRLLTGEDAVICVLAGGSCPLQVLRAMTGGRHTAVCSLRTAPLREGQNGSGDVPAGAVRRHLTGNVPTIEADTPLSALARSVIDGRVPKLIVVDARHRPIGTVSGVDVLAALAQPGSFRRRAVDTRDIGSRRVPCKGRRDGQPRPSQHQPAPVGERGRRSRAVPKLPPGDPEPRRLWAIPAPDRTQPTQPAQERSIP